MRKWIDKVKISEEKNKLNNKKKELMLELDLNQKKKIETILLY